MTKASKRQVGGSHYKDCPIQPIEIIFANGLNWNVGHIVKYSIRCGKKGELLDWVKDLDKIIHYAELEKERLLNGSDSKDKEI